LNDYSSRQLTDLEDRLNAFQGISSEIEKQSGKKVRYGMPGFGCGVLGREAKIPSPSRSTRAPSWSWGCLNTLVDGPCYRGKYDGTGAGMRFVDDDPAKLVVTAFVLDGATWDGVHHSVEGSCQAPKKGNYTCWPDLKIGLPDPPNRYYLGLVGIGNYLLYSGGMVEMVLILESAGCGTYRRTGIYWGYGFAGKWPEEPQEVTLV